MTNNTKRKLLVAASTALWFVMFMMLFYALRFTTSMLSVALFHRHELTVQPGLFELVVAITFLVMIYCLVVMALFNHTKLLIEITNVYYGLDQYQLPGAKASYFSFKI